MSFFKVHVHVSKVFSEDGVEFIKYYMYMCVLSNNAAMLQSFHIP